MNGNKKRALMLLTSACMTISAMPVSALAFDAKAGVHAQVTQQQAKAESRYKLAEGFSIMGEDASKWRANGVDSVSIDVQFGDIYYTGSSVRNTAKNVFLHGVEKADFTISAKLDFKPGQDFQSAGLIIYKDGNANFAATRRYHSYFGNKALCIQGVDGNKFTEGNVADPSQEQAPLFLQVVKKGTTVTSYYRLSEEDEWTQYDNRTWNSFSGVSAEELRVGLYTGNSKSNGSTATFSDFTIQYEGEEARKLDIFEETDEPEELTEYVSDWDWFSASVGYGQPRKDCGVDGTNDPIVLGGKTYAKGLAMHADSEVVYDIEGKGVTRFQAVAGVNRAAGSCQFIVEIDGKEVVKTDIIQGNQNTENIDVEIPAGAKKLTLLTNVGGDNGNSDHSVWADAKFVMDPNVNREDLRKISANASSYLPIGGEDEINVVGELVNGSEADLSDAKITYESSDEAILSVDANGLMTANADGKATVTVKVVAGNATCTDTIEVIVGEGEGRMWGIKSPDESLQTMFMLTKEGVGKYFVLQDNKVVVENSKLGLVTDIADFTSGLSFEGQSEVQEVVDEYDLYGAKVSKVKAVGNEMILSFAKDNAQLNVIVRMYDNGMAFRYEVKGEDGEAMSVSSEGTTMTLPGDSMAYAMDYINHNEEIERKHKALELTSDYCMPLLYQVDDTWCLISEAELSPEYCGTYLKGDGTGSLNFHFSKEQKGDVSTESPLTTPWRYVVIGTAEEVNLNTMGETLSPDCEGDFSWVQPGVTAWTWLNRESTSDFNTYKKYVDFAAQMQWEYLLLDEGWQPKGNTQGHSEFAYYGYFDWTEDLIEYANEKGVRLLVWANHNDLKNAAEREKRFAQWEEWGIAGIKPDFFNSSSQTYMELYDALIKETAEHKLLLNLHGMPKPAGERRTYPHLLTREGVFGHEQELFRPSDMSAFHNCMLPFTRNAVGPADYTPMLSYRNSKGKQTFSLSHMAAMAVVYESGIQCLADRPEEYIGSAAEFYFKGMPATWDESVVLQADPGELVTIARRNGENWYVGAMCNTQHDAVIDLSFLGDGEYYAVITKDGDAKDKMVSDMMVVTKDDVLTIPMLETGGAALKILKEKPSQPESITLSAAELTLDQYETAELQATIAPEDTEMNQVTWSSSDENVVAVKNGQLTAVNPGHAVITASTGFAGEMKAQCEVEVRLPKYSVGEDWEIMNMDPGYWEINDENSVTIQTQIGEIYTGKVTVNNMFLIPVEDSEDFTANVKLEFAPNANYQTAGLILFQDIENSFTVSERFHSSFGGNILAYHGLNNGKWVENNSSSAVKLTGEEEGPVSLQLTKKGNTVSAYYKWANQTEWTKICDQTYTGLTGDLKLGLYVANAGNTDAHVPATFSDFTVQYGDGEAKAIPFAVKNEIVVEESDKEDLAALIQYAKDAQEAPSYAYVVPKVKALFEKALADAAAVNANAAATQAQVDAAYDALLAKVHLLDFTGNAETLQSVVSVANGKVESAYTKESWAPFKAALEAAQKVLDDVNALQAEIDAARDELQAKMDALVKITVNKDKLAKLVADAAKYEAEIGKYTNDTAAAFTAALEGARDVLETAEVQDEVNAAYSSLLSAIFGLRETPNKDKLENLLNKVEAMDLSVYSAQTASAVKAAYAKAMAVFEDENADQAKVDAAVAALEKAVKAANAEAGEASSDNSDATDKKDDNKVASEGAGSKQATGKTNKTAGNTVAKTGDGANATLPTAAGLAAILAAIKAWRKRNE